MSWAVSQWTPRAMVLDAAAATLPNDIVTAARNVDFFTGSARALSEIASVLTPVGAPVALQFYQNATIRKFGYGTAAGFRGWDGTTDASMLPGSGLTGSDYWSLDAFGSYLTATNGKAGEEPYAVAASAGVLAKLPGWVAGNSAKILATHRNVLFACDTIEGGQPYPNRVRWSASATAGGLPQEWVPSPSNDAGQVDLEIPGGVIYAAVAQGDTMYIGGPGGIWAARWQGGAYVYQFGARTTEWGLRGYKSMVSMGDVMACLTRNDIVVFDDTTHKSLMVGRVSSVLRTMTTAQLMYIESARQLYLFYGLPGDSLAGYPHALVYDRDTDSWGNREFAQTFTGFGKGLQINIGAGYTWATAPGSWAAYVGAWTNPSQDTDVYLAANGQMVGRAGGATWNWSIERQNMPGPENESVRVRSLEVDIQGPIGQTVQVRIGSAKYPGDSPSWGRIGSYTVGQGSLRHDDIQRGRYISYQIGGNGNARVSAVRMHYVVNEQKP